MDLRCVITLCSLASDCLTVGISLICGRISGCSGFCQFSFKIMGHPAVLDLGSNTNQPHSSYCYWESVAIANDLFGYCQVFKLWYIFKTMCALQRWPRKMIDVGYMTAIRTNNVFTIVTSTGMSGYKYKIKHVPLDVLSMQQCAFHPWL